MSVRPVRCPVCRVTVLAQSRPALSGKRLRAIPDLAYAEPSTKPGVVRVRCPGCQEWVDIRGRLVIEAA